MESNDVFSFIRALDNHAGDDNADAGNGADATPAEHDVFSGSEPVQASPVAVAESAPATSPVAPSAPGATVATSKDVTAVLLSAVDSLHERLSRVEAYLRQNGVL